MVSLLNLSEFGRDSGQSLDAVRDGSKSTKRPPTACSPPDAIDATRKKINRRRDSMLRAGTSPCARSKVVPQRRSKFSSTKI